MRRRIVLPLGGPLADTDHVIGHELVHAFQFDITSGPNTGPDEAAPNVCRCGSSKAWPSTCRSGRSIRTRRCGCATRRGRTRTRKSRPETLPTIKDLDNPKYFPYRWGQALWAYVAGRWGDEVIRQLLTQARGDRRYRRGVRTRARHQVQAVHRGLARSILKTYDASSRAATPLSRSGVA